MSQGTASIPYILAPIFHFGKMYAHAYQSLNPIELTIQEGGKNACATYFGHIHFKSDQSGIKSKCEIYTMKPHVEKCMCKILKIG